MSNLWEIQPVKDATSGKYTYQPVTLVITGVSPEVKNYKNGDYQNCQVLGRAGANIPASIFYQTGSPKITPEQLNTPIECRVKVEPDTGRFAVDGLKYTLMLGEKKKSSGGSGGYSGGGKSYSKPSPEESKEKRAMMCLSYAKDLAAAKVIEIDDITSRAEFFYRWIDLFMSEIDAPKQEIPI